MNGCHVSFRDRSNGSISPCLRSGKEGDKAHIRLTVVYAQQVQAQIYCSLEPN